MKLILTKAPSVYGFAVANDADKGEVSSDSDPSRERSYSSEADKIVDGMDFGELCNEFECISSPLVESTARQLVRDILELREGNRAIGTFAVSVTYKVPNYVTNSCLHHMIIYVFTFYLGQRQICKPFHATFFYNFVSLKF